MAAAEAGEGPKTLSFAPIRAAKGTPRWRSCVSGPTKGTVDGKEATSGVYLGPFTRATSRCNRKHVLEALAEREETRKTFLFNAMVRRQAAGYAHLGGTLGEDKRP